MASTYPLFKKGQIFTRSLFIILHMCVLVSAQSLADLNGALDSLSNHIAGTDPLNAADIKAVEQTVVENDTLLETSKLAIKKAIAVVDEYESKIGPLWISAHTKTAKINRTPVAGLELEYAMIAVMQGLLDHAYTLSNIKNYKSSLEGKSFETSKYFPGAVSTPVDPTNTYTVKVNATLPASWGTPVMHDEEHARRTTGGYVAPGSYVTIEVPQALVNKNFNIRVGAHSWDLQKKPRYERLDRVSLLFPINASSFVVTHPLGGGIYLEVPPEAAEGLVDLKITGAARSPLYRATYFHQTTSAEWKSTERNHPGPWTDFESDKVMMQVPTSWITEYDSIEQNIKDWDKSLDMVSDLMGRPHYRNQRSILYQQIDVIIRGSAYHPGYPFSNDTYDPNKKETGNKNHYFLTGPQTGSSIVFHEMGHAQLFTKFPGEVEAVVNLPYVAAMSRGFGWSLDSALSKSMGKKTTISLDQAAIMWMVAPNFRDGKPMDITNSTKNEVRYQHRGYSKYVEIAKLFGWDALGDFWHSVNIDYGKGITYNRNNDEKDNRILRMSRAAGVDLRPLIHFWGTHPGKDDTLKAAIHAEDLLPSALIYDQLMRYKTLIPKDNAEFIAHADIVFPERDGTGNVDYAKGWYSFWESKYNQTQGKAAQNELQNIIDYYFPNGRPNIETTIPTPNPSKFAIAPTHSGSQSVSMTSVVGKDDSGPVLYQFTERSGMKGGTTSGWQKDPTYIDDNLITGKTYIYSVRMRDINGNTTVASEFMSVTLGELVTSIPMSNKAFALTPEGLYLQEEGVHWVSVYNLKGKKVFQVQGKGPASYTKETFSHQLAQGIYFLKVQIKGQSLTEKFILD